MGRVLCLALLLLLVTGCAQPAPPLSERERVAVADTITAEMNSYVAAMKELNVPNVLGHFGNPDQFRFIDNGTVYSYPQVQTMVQGVFGTLRSFDPVFHSIHVNVLNRDVAVADASYTDVFTDTTGAVTRIRGTVTFVWVRTPEGWRIIHGQGFGTPDSTAAP